LAYPYHYRHGDPSNPQMSSNDPGNVAHAQPRTQGVDNHVSSEDDYNKSAGSRVGFVLLRRGLVTFLASPVTLGVGIVGGSGLGVSSEDDYNKSTREKNSQSRPSDNSNSKGNWASEARLILQIRLARHGVAGSRVGFVLLRRGLVTFLASSAVTQLVVVATPRVSGSQLVARTRTP
jgi:hypothetical protein